jgi:putative spermidine/putrescine transport system permease protein
VQLSRRAKWILGLFMALGLAFVYVPLFIVVLNSFNTSLTFEFPPPSFTTQWWGLAFENQGVRDALVTSVVTAVIATSIALVLGTLAAMSVSRYSFFGRDTVSLLLVLPIALPGIVTGLALNSVFTGFLGGLTFLTLVVGHATFCIVVVFNNAAARLRRVAGNVEEASMDLGASRIQTFRYITFPAIRSSLVAGALLAFGLSFDEIIVTVFTAGPGIETLPIWIFTNLFRPNQAPVVNVVAAFLVVVSVIPIWLSQKLSSDTAVASRT